MDIKLIPAVGGQVFTFPALPEKIKGKYAAKYQSFDIISQGTVKMPKGTGVAEFSWDGVFFGSSKRYEAIVRTNAWKEPNECVNMLYGFMKKEETLNLIVTETWINVDVTIASFTPGPVGAYGNIEYSITFAQKKPLLIYDTSELQISDLAPRNDTSSLAEEGKGAYTVKSGDTLSAIAKKHCGGTVNWPKLYNANAATIEETAKAHGKSSSDHGHWIWPGEVLQLV